MALPLPRAIPTLIVAAFAAAAMLASRRPEPPPASGEEAAEQLEHARRPISYFNARCGSCHGNYGSYWIEEDLAKLGGKELVREVEEMAAGPARSPLEGRALAVQVAYHRSLIDGRPFATAFAGEKGLAGEVTPGASVTLLSGGREHAAKVEGHAWSSTVREAEKLRVEKGGKRGEIDLKGLGQTAPVRHSHAASE